MTQIQRNKKIVEMHVKKSLIVGCLLLISVFAYVDTIPSIMSIGNDVSKWTNFERVSDVSTAVSDIPDLRVDAEGNVIACGLMRARLLGR